MPMPGDRKSRKSSRISKTDRLKNLELAPKIFALRKEGFSFVDISAQLGLKVTTTVKLFKHWLAKLDEKCVESAEDLRKITQARIEGVIEALWPNRHVPRHAEVILKANEGLAKLRGLDAPQQHLHLTVSLNDLTDDELALECKKLGLPTPLRTTPALSHDARPIDLLPGEYATVIESPEPARDDPPDRAVQPPGGENSGELLPDLPQLPDDQHEV